jgi:hypothetical protein
MGTEAGETLAGIVDRKERERRATGGIFLWGIGNSVGAAILELVRSCPVPEVLFSPTKSQPRPIDVMPDRRVVWTAGRTTTGDLYRLPSGTRVMGGVIDGRKLPPRYALVCASDEALALSDQGRLRFGSLRNLLSGRPVGASQVTAVVRSQELSSGPGGGDYQISFRARLVEPYFIRLSEPVVVADSDLSHDWLGAVVA